MKTPVLVTGPTTGPGTGGTTWSSIIDFQTWTSNESITPCSVAAAGTISNLRVRSSTALTQGSYVFTFRKGSAPTGGGSPGAMASQSVTCTLDTTHQEASDDVNSFTVAEGDVVNIQSVPSGTPTACGTVYISYVFTSSATGQSYICFGQTSSTSINTSYLPLQTHSLLSTSDNESTRSLHVPPGTFTKLFINLTAAPGSGVTITYALRVNGVDSGLSVAISGTSVSGSASASVPVSTGDQLSISRTVTGGTPAAALAHGSLQFQPTTDGESPLYSGINGTLAATGTIYTLPAGEGSNATETLLQAIAPCQFTWKNAYVSLSAAPGSGKNRAFAARVNGAAASPAMAVTIADTATTGNDTTNAVTVNTSDLIDWMQVPSGSPAVSRAAFGATAFIQTPIAVGLCTATNTSLALAGGHKETGLKVGPLGGAPLGTVYEPAQVMVGAVGVSAAANLALALGVVEALAVGLCSETDTSLALAQGTSGTPVGLSTESDTALTLGALELLVTGVSSEADSIPGLGAGLATGVSTEADASLALGAIELLATGISSEGDTALGLGMALGARLSSETETALMLAPREVAVAGVSVESDSVPGLGAALGAGASTESEAALALAAVLSEATGISSETETALAPSAVLVGAAGLSSESGTALAPSAVLVGAAGLSTESDAAPGLGMALGVGLSAETDAALALTTPGAITGTLVVQESGSDIFVGSGTVEVSGSLAAQESGADAFAGSGTVVVSGALAAQESGADAFAGSGPGAIITGSLAAQESGADVLTGSSEVTVTGVFDAQESGSDTLTGLGTVAVSGSLAAQEPGQDNFVGAGPGAIVVSFAMPPYRRRSKSDSRDRRSYSVEPVRWSYSTDDERLSKSVA